MKKALLILIGILLTTQVSFGQKEVQIQKKELPEVSNNLIDQHFKTLEISYCTRDNDSFEVKFTNGQEIEFDKRGNWKEIDCKKSAVPTVLVPKGVQEYVKKNNPKASVVKIERDASGYEVKLNNGLELKFDKNEQFKRIDD